MKKLLLAIPKGRILEDLTPIFNKANLKMEDDFYNESSRKLIFSTNLPNLEVVKVRSFDVATFVKFGAADIGICGSDVIEEFSSDEIFPLIDLNIGKCRLSIASLKPELTGFAANNLENLSHIRIATKYVEIARKYFAKQAIQAEPIKLSGSIEIAPKLGLCDYILDLVSSGKTLQENNMVEISKIMDVTSFVIVNRASLKTKNFAVNQIIDMFKNAA